MVARSSRSRSPHRRRHDLRRIRILLLATRRSDALLAAQLTADHSKCFKLFGPPDGTAADALNIERMLFEQYGWKIHVPSSSADDDVQLIGARRCLYGDGLVPHVMYRVHGQDVSLFVLPGSGTRKADDLVTLGHRSQIWSGMGRRSCWCRPRMLEAWRARPDT